MKTREKKFLTKVLHKMCEENGVNKDNVYISDFGYIETVNVNNKDVDFCKTEYNDCIYSVEYHSGCFNPFLIGRLK